MACCLQSLLVLFDQTLVSFRVGGDLAIHCRKIKTRALGGSRKMGTLVPA